MQNFRLSYLNFSNSQKNIEHCTEKHKCFVLFSLKFVENGFSVIMSGDNGRSSKFIFTCDPTAVSQKFS